ncbi:MAG: hypothetical protein ABIG96_01340 [Candidatus Micrarchaeota archaeon]
MAERNYGMTFREGGISIRGKAVRVHQNEDEEEVRKHLENQNDVRLTYTHITHRTAGKPTNWVAVIDNIALPRREFPNLPLHLTNAIRGLENENPASGNLRQITLRNTWLLTDPKIYKFMVDRSARHGFTIQPETMNPKRQIDYIRLVRKNLGAYSLRAKRVLRSKPAEYRKAIALKSDVIRAIKEARRGDTIPLTRSISNMVQQLKPEIVRQLMPGIFRSFYLKPKSGNDG